MTRRRKYNKNKRKTRTRRLSPAYSPASYYNIPEISYYPDVMSAVYAFRDMTNPLKYEICATIEYKEPNWLLYLHNTTDSSDDGRHMCRYKYHDSIILHNHPDKYHPSLQDIEKMLKKTPRNIIIRKSFIVSKIGIWEFTVSPENKLDESEIETKRTQLDEVLTKFYNNKYTERGRKYDAPAVKEICRKLRKIYGITAEFHAL